MRPVTPSISRIPTKLRSWCKSVLSVTTARRLGFRYYRKWDGGRKKNNNNTTWYLIKSWTNTYFANGHKFVVKCTISQQLIKNTEILANVKHILYIHHFNFSGLLITQLLLYNFDLLHLYLPCKRQCADNFSFSFECCFLSCTCTRVWLDIYVF